MSHPSHPSSVPVPNSVIPTEGWHCAHYYYRFDRAVLKGIAADDRQTGRQEFCDLLANAGADRTERLQSFITGGHKADFGIMVMDPHPLKVDSIHQRLLATRLGPALVPVYSFISMSEVSEYVPTIEQYGERLVAGGEVLGSPAYEAKLTAYKNREPMMRKQRLHPDFPDYPAMCFYPMNKKRKVGENWFYTPFSERNRMMAEHAKSGIAFAGKVSQLITVGLGIEDWEWGVTLWARNPEFLKEIVYKMRFDEASARFAEFGPFYTGYVSSATDILSHCFIT
ncbi:MAG: heme-dependent peroxidase [Planctomycetota bacterium]|nr:heme-dependent peroxidase [Planctomycetota bacterium]